MTDVEVIGEEKGRIKFRAIPDPRVWEKRTADGESGYWHKIDNIFLFEKDLAKAVPMLKDKPIHVENIGLKNKDEYFKEKQESN
jgi:hypothetical protein